MSRVRASWWANSFCYSEILYESIPINFQLIHSKGPELLDFESYKHEDILFETRKWDVAQKLAKIGGS